MNFRDTFAVADASYQTMLRRRTHSGESGSGKTTDGYLIIMKRCRLEGVEQTLISACPVFESFKKLRRKHNNNSSPT